LKKGRKRKEYGEEGEEQEQEEEVYLYSPSVCVTP